MKNFYVAGASSRARTTRVYLEYLNADMKILAFLVSPEMTDNEPVVDGVPVVKITSSLHQIPSLCPPQSEESSGQDSVQEMVEAFEVSEDSVQKKPEQGNGRESILNTSLPVYLGTRGINHPKLEAELRSIGFTDIIPVDMHLDSELRNAYLTKFYAENNRELIRMDMLRVAGSASSHANQFGLTSDVCLLYADVDGKAGEKSGEVVDALKERKNQTARIYVASSIFDVDEYWSIPEEQKIQVGCALTEDRIDGCHIFDNEGENISNLNKHFCELTGLYWIWKNAAEDYVGLVHYRRHFLLQSNWVDVCRDNAVDVILPVPLYVSPSVAENYRERHIASDWDYLMEYFKKNLPGEYDDIVRILGGGLYSPCNMIIARREVLGELCSWMFPIIFDVYEHCGVKEDSYQSRYPGFISERLITYYFESRRDKYKVVYCNKNFLR